MRFAFFAALSLGVMFALARVNPDRWLLPIGFLLFIGSFLALVAIPFLPESITPVINGARRWIDLGFFKVAPIEFFKVGFVFFLAWSARRKLWDKQYTFWEEVNAIAPYMFLTLLVAFISIFYQSDLGQVMMIMLLTLVVLLFAGLSSRLFSVILGIGTLFAVIGIFQAGYRMDRIKGSLYILSTMLPESWQKYFNLSSDNIYYQVQQSINAIHHGGFFGTGFGNGIYKLGFLSDVHTDFILAGIAEEGGFLVISIITTLIVALVYRLIRISNRSENTIYHLFTFGIALLIGSQFLVNALGITGLIPLKGLTVPFVSYGGSSMLSLGIAVGMVLMISQKAKL